jgi:4-hydroxy-tetrahydrodipicolinate synthase
VFEGTYTALVTPFSGDGIDFPALRRLIDAQVAAGVQGVVPCGSTGESATLSHDEHERVIAATVDHVAGRMRVIAGTGSNSTRESVRLTRWAKEHGADGALLIAPYYNKPTQDGLRAHYETVAEGVDLPLVVYNIPGRSAVNIAPETMAKLAEIPHIVGVKEASGSLDQVSRTVQLCGSKLTVLSGDDSLTLPIMSLGGRGVIAVVSNLVPERLRKLVDAALAGDYASAREQHYALLPLMQAMGLETNPIPVKTALAMLGRCSPELRLPLTSLREENMAGLRKVLQSAGLSSKLS